MNILQINSSARSTGSESTRLADAIVAKLQAANPGATVARRDLAATHTRCWTKRRCKRCSPRPTSAPPNKRPAWRLTTP